MKQPVNQTKFEPSEVSLGAGALSGTYDTFSNTDPVEACKEALESGKFY